MSFSGVIPDPLALFEFISSFWSMSESLSQTHLQEKNNERYLSETDSTKNVYLASIFGIISKPKLLLWEKSNKERASYKE